MASLAHWGINFVPTFSEKNILKFEEILCEAI
jgi:hypothetical protein